MGASVSFAAVVNVALNLLLIPAYGMIGAATATATSTLLWNFLLVVVLWYRTGIDGTFVGFPRLSR